MRFPVVYREQQAGWVEVEKGPHGMDFHAESPCHTLAVLRLYAITEAESLLVGVMEPKSGTLHLSRRITPETLRTAKVTEIPQIYYLEDGQPGCRPDMAQPESSEDASCPSVQGNMEEGPEDPLVRRLLASDMVTCTTGAGGWELRAPFSPARAHPLHFALTACSIAWRDGQPEAVLRIGRTVSEKTPDRAAR